MSDLHEPALCTRAGRRNTPTAGRSIHWYPAGLLTIVSGILVTSRLLVKHHAKLFATVPTER